MKITYLAELENEVGRLRRLCAEVLLAIPLIFESLNEKEKNLMREVADRLHNAAQGHPFILNSEPKEKDDGLPT